MEYKGFKLVSDGTMGYWTISQTGSGAVPSSLRGMYTTAKVAMSSIDAYQPKRGAKKKDVEDNTTA